MNDDNQYCFDAILVYLKNGYRVRREHWPIGIYCILNTKENAVTYGYRSYNYHEITALRWTPSANDINAEDWMLD